MAMDYSVRFGEQSVGRAQVTRQGLYYRVVCRCNLSGEVMYRLEVSCGDKRENLGILVPEETGFGLDTRFPVSRVGEGALSFRILPRHDTLQGRKFVPITPEEPFVYLERLKDAFLETRNGVKGISIPENRDKDVEKPP